MKPHPLRIALWISIGLWALGVAAGVGWLLADLAELLETVWR